MILLILASQADRVTGVSHLPLASATTYKKQRKEGRQGRMEGGEERTNERKRERKKETKKETKKGKKILLCCQDFRVRSVV
jgi:hypothetical protein